MAIVYRVLKKERASIGRQCQLHYLGNGGRNRAGIAGRERNRIKKRTAGKLGLAVAAGLGFCLISVAQEATVWVDDDFTPENCGGHTWDVNAFSNIQAGVDAVAAGGTVKNDTMPVNKGEWPAMVAGVSHMGKVGLYKCSIGRWTEKRLDVCVIKFNRPQQQKGRSV